MREITGVGIDLAKQVIQVHAVDPSGHAVVRRAVPRQKFLDWCVQLPPQCRLVMEACSGAHHWARQLAALGRDVRLIAPHLVTPYRLQGRHGKNDANDAAAIWEAACRPGMHFVPVKTVEQQAMLAVHTSRSALMSERTALINRIRAIVAEFGVVLPVGVAKLRERLPLVLEDGSNELPGRTRQLLVRQIEHWRRLDELIDECDREIAQHVRQDTRAQQAQRLLGIGPLGASALVATVSDFAQFSSGRQFACWLGLTPSQNSSGGKSRLGSITKQGDSYLRMLLVQGAKSAVHLNKPKDSRIGRWLLALKERSGWQKAAVALAAKNARIVWAMLARGKPFDPDHLSVRPI